MPLSCSLAMVVLTFNTLGTDVSHLSTSEASFLEVLLVMLLELLSKLVFDVVSRALEELFDLKVVALFRAATGVNGAIEGFENAKEVIGDGLVVGEVMKYLILIRDEMT